MAAELLVLQHVDREGPDRIAHWATERGLSLRVIRPNQGEPLPDPVTQGPALAVMLGGPMSVNDRNQTAFQWLERELSWLQQWIQQKRPVLGICLGAQLLCTAAGGHVKPLTSGNPPQPLKEVGFGAIQWRASSSEVPWLASIPQQQVVLHWHGDRCCLPKKAKILASSPHCQEQAFQLGASAVGLQFHIEVTKPNLERWVTEDQEFILAAGLKPNQINDEALEWDSELSSKGRFLLDALLDHLLSQV